MYGTVEIVSAGGELGGVQSVGFPGLDVATVKIVRRHGVRHGIVVGEDD